MKLGLQTSGRKVTLMPETSPVVLITGAGVRLGAEAALTLGKRGCKLALHYRSSRAGLDSVVEQLKDLKCDYEIFQADLQDPQTHRPLVENVLKRFGGIDVLLNNAGIYKEVAFEEVSESAFDEMIAINLKAPFFLAQAAAQSLKERGGSIINITDTDVAAPYGGFAHYFASKGGLEVVTRALAKELGPEIRVNGIGPGTVAIPVGMSEEEGLALGDAVPLKRVGTPSDIANAVEFLTFNAPYMTGQILRIDGGRVV